MLKGEVEIAPGKLTIFCGGNNTGKTYAMYVLWALLQRRRHIRHVFSFAARLADQLKVEGSLLIPLEDFFSQHWSTIEKGIADGLRKRLSDLFSAPPKFFESTQLRISIDLNTFLAAAQKNTEFRRSINVGAESTLDLRLMQGENGPAIALTALDAGKLPGSLLSEIISALIVELVLGSEVDDAFLLPAERGGLNLFYLDLDAKNSALVRHLKRDESNPLELIKDLMVAQYAEPIDAYIQFLKKTARTPRSGGEFHDQAQALQKDITRVRYKVNKDGVITAKPYRSDTELGIHLTSSTNMSRNITTAARVDSA